MLISLTVWQKEQRAAALFPSASRPKITHGPRRPSENGSGGGVGVGGGFNRRRSVVKRAIYPCAPDRGGLNARLRRCALTCEGGGARGTLNPWRHWFDGPGAANLPAPKYKGRPFDKGGLCFSLGGFRLEGLGGFRRLDLKRELAEAFFDRIRGHRFAPGEFGLRRDHVLCAEADHLWSAAEPL